MNEGVILEYLGESLAPGELMQVSEWAEKYRILNSVSVARPGKYSLENAPYQAGPMDAFLDPNIDTIVLIWSSQTGKTEVLLNILGYLAHKSPCPIMCVLPRNSDCREFMKTRIKPMVESCQNLKELYDEKNSEVMTLLFRGGMMNMATAGSPAALASRPIRVVLMDEIDRYDADIKGEGDVISLAEKRTATFPNSKIILTSTPTNKGNSRIEDYYNLSDKRRFFVPCCGCGFFQVLEWANVIWENDDPSSAKYMCCNCGELFSNEDVKKQVRFGEWRKTAERPSRIAGFHLNELSSQWVSIEKTVEAFLKAKNHIPALKSFINTALAETWEERGTSVDWEKIKNNREDYEKLPSGALVLVCGVDVQNDRLEGEVVAYGKDEESWGVEYFVLPGDPSLDRVWDDLDRQLLKMYPHESGIKLSIKCTCIDCGFATNKVYDFCRGKEFRRIFPTKGAPTENYPLYKAVTENRKTRYNVGTHTAKKIIYSRLQLKKDGAGFMHFNKKYDDDYFKGLTAEKSISKIDKYGRVHIEWKKIRGRNEPLDCRVMSLVAMNILNPEWETIEKNLLRVTSKNKEKEVKQFVKANKVIINRSLSNVGAIGISNLLN